MSQRSPSNGSGSATFRVDMQKDGNFMQFVNLVGGLVAIFYFPIYWVANHPN